MRVLHVAAECFPFVKTGGLGDVAAALPPALCDVGVDARLLLPGYPAVLEALEDAERVACFGPAFGAATVEILRGRLRGMDARVYVVRAPILYGRSGNPFLGADGRDWSDNLQRFALLAYAAAQLALNVLDASWAPEIVHAHDWHAALACAYIAAHPAPNVKTVFTIHNLAYQGLFPVTQFASLGLPERMVGVEGLEFFSLISFMKAGIQYADMITTVSPTYAKEIQSYEFGCGLDGLLRKRGHALHGILNGVDAAVWSPLNDPNISVPYSVGKMKGKAACKAVLQQSMGLAATPDKPLFAVVSRLTEQKGLDLLAAQLPLILESGAQLVVLGTGSADLEAVFRRAAASHPLQVVAVIGYDEVRAHSILAGADVILVPSRFEPCGLTQLYGLAYGTLPLVRRTGGLADTVVDADAEAIAAGRATGFVFESATSPSLGRTIQAAVTLYADQITWSKIQKHAMQQDFSWRRAAESYRALYVAMLA